MTLLLIACNTGADTGGPARLHIPVLDAPAPPGRTVVWFTIDTLNQDHLGPDSIHPSSPNHNEFFEEGVLLQNTLVTRGVTVISLPSIATGTYPRTHGVYDKDIPAPDDMPPMVQELLKDEGWSTFGYSSNICVMQNRGWNKAVCVDGTPVAEGLTDRERDQVVVDAFVDDLDHLPPDRDAFFWLHLRDPHVDYSARVPWIDEFYDGPREDRSPIEGEELRAITLGELEPGDDFENWLEAVYASQVASGDEMLGQVREALEEAGRWDIVFTGTDHGEELGAHHDYYQHGCSTYEPVLNTTWSFQAPGLEPAVVDQRVSTTDMLPTLLDLLEIRIPEEIEGRSLVPVAVGQRTESVPVFFQRGTNTAGTVVDGRKYFLHAGDDLPRCSPFDDDHPWPGPTEGLYDLDADPDENDNLNKVEPHSAEKTILCQWVVDYAWGKEYSKALALIQACTDHLDE